MSQLPTDFAAFLQMKPKLNIYYALYKQLVFSIKTKDYFMVFKQFGQKCRLPSARSRSTDARCLEFQYVNGMMSGQACSPGLTYEHVCLLKFEFCAACHCLCMDVHASGVHLLVENTIGWKGSELPPPRCSARFRCGSCELPSSLLILLPQPGSRL